jgi:Zn-dependent peptidase ImmA (M78 family)/DNA-binding XRE family transcriptional regulator
VTPSPLASRLQEARDRLRLTQDQVEGRTGIGKSTLSQFENAQRLPSLAQLERLAQLYRRAVTWFLDAGAGPEPEAAVLWRDRPERSIAAEVGANFLRLCEQYRDLETWCQEPAGGEFSVPALPTHERFQRRDAVRLAKHVRDHLQLGDRPSGGLMSALEEVCGLKIFHLPFEPTGTAASSRSRALGAAVLLNSSNVPWRRSFDLAHEFFHLLTWRVFQAGWEGDPPVATAQEEKFANIFAENLLMPEEPFRLAVGRRMDPPDPGRIDQVHALAREFGVSVPAVLTRMRFLFRLEEDQISGARAAWQRISPCFKDRPAEPTPPRPERFTALALTALERGEISIGRFAEYMGISRYRAMAIARQQEEDGEEGDPSAPA